MRRRRRRRSNRQNRTVRCKFPHFPYHKTVPNACYASSKLQVEADGKMHIEDPKNEIKHLGGQPVAEAPVAEAPVPGAGDSKKEGEGLDVGREKEAQMMEAANARVAPEQQQQGGGGAPAA